MFTIRPPAASTAGSHTLGAYRLEATDRAILAHPPSARHVAGEVGLLHLADSRRRRAVRPPSAVGDDMLQRLPVADDKAAATLVEDTPVAPRGQLHAHALS